MAETKSKYITGFCGIGSHEGTKPKSPSGAPMKTCEAVDLCTCACHRQITQMFEIAEMPRQIMSNPEYMPVMSPYQMPSIEEIVASRANHNGSSNDAEDIGPIVLKSPAPGILPATMGKHFTPTPTGRAGRGELEAWVLKVVSDWVVDQSLENCTPRFIAEQIASEQGFGAPPSVGAVDACLKRWVKLGFAVIEKKPTRFVAFTQEGIDQGLDVLREKSKMRKKSIENKIKLGHRS